MSQFASIADARAALGAPAFWELFKAEGATAALPFESASAAPTHSGPGPYVIPGQSLTGETPDQNSMVFPGLLLDWITLRIPVRELGPNLQEQLQSRYDLVACFSMTDGRADEVQWQQTRYRYDDLRSDSAGLFVTVKWVGNTDYLYIGASPASLIHQCNVFGSLDIQDAAETIWARARVAFQSFLPDWQLWECVRLDVTGNYALPDKAAVKLALKQLLSSDSARRRATSSAKGGDTVLWSPTSDLLGGKAYHKGPHLAYLVNSGKLELPPEQIELADRLLRLEMRVGSRWFRRLREGRLNKELRNSKWWELDEEMLAQLFVRFFEPVCGGVEVDMTRVDLLHEISRCNAISEGRARAALGTYRAIKAEGLDPVKASMAHSTFFRHKKYLLAAGISEADLCAGNVFQFRPVRIVLAQPVRSWEELRRAA